MKKTVVANKAKNIAKAVGYAAGSGLAMVGSAWVLTYAMKAGQKSIEETYKAFKEEPAAEEPAAEEPEVE